MIEIISILTDCFLLYLVAGLIFAVYFVLAGAKRLDEGVQNTPFHFKLILIPGAILIWPLLTFKLLRS